MDKIVKRLQDYIDAHPFDPADSDCETVLDQLYQAYAESHESDPLEIKEGLRNWRDACVCCRWTTIMLCSICAVAFVLRMNEKRSLTVYNMVHT